MMNHIFDHEMKSTCKMLESYKPSSSGPVRQKLRLKRHRLRKTMFTKPTTITSTFLARPTYF